MKTTLKWIAGVIFLIIALTSFVSGGLGILGGLLFVLAGLLCLPPTLTIIETKLNTTLKTPVKYVLVIVFWVSGALIMPKSKTLATTNLTNTSNSKVQNNSLKENPTLALKTKVANNIKSLEGGDNFTDGKEYTSADQFIIFAALYKSYAITINEAKKSDDPDIKKLTDELVKKVTTSQQKNFPKIRQKYFEFVKQKLWENDVYVDLSGSGNTNLKFTGSYFAANKNIKTTQDALSEMLHLLRFKQTQYRWYKDQDDYQYFTIESEKDIEIKD